MSDVMDQQAVVADIERRARRVGVSIRALCQRVQVHPVTFSKWKRSERNPEPHGASLLSIGRFYEALDQIESGAGVTAPQGAARMSEDFMDSRAARDAAKAFAEQRRERLRWALFGLRETLTPAAEKEASRASVVRWQAEALVELIDQRIDDALVVQGVVRAGLVGNALQKAAQVLERLGIALFHQGQRGDLQVALRRDLALQKAVAIFEHPHAVLDGHFQGSSSDISNNPDANPADPADHRLCEERI